ncbi:PIG-L deacetylase family protein [Armatimonas sp.]|uniref:PIG-L deacetylase family protein n=1 Tax=Armatimonas sp. TaxID=1872638 RepID=UPI00374CDA99
MYHILCIGAHPDDNELNLGGLATRLRRRGDAVKFVSVTNGDKGHFADEYKADPEKLAARRLIEAQEAAGVIGATYETLGIHDGEVYVDKPTTEAMVRCIRSFGEPGRGPDLVIFNRPLDYHRDHRYTAQLILDATYMLTVPLMCPDTHHLDRMPVFAYWYDTFKDIQPFVAEIQVPITDCLEEKTSMVCHHASQFFEWLPYNAGVLHEVPSDDEGRRARVRGIVEGRGAYRAERSTGARINGGACHHAEAFRVCEYGRQPGDDALRALFGL